MITLTLKKGNEKDVELLIDIAEKLGLELVVSEKEEAQLTAKEKVFLGRLNRSAHEAKEIAAGIRKGKSLNELLNEL
ncbi:MAG TPA: hypothetical protein DDW85_15185 [Porphyromonadaceae bacterium]|nr:hypothetical protein [Porphyromonadaceae bacterium]